MSEYLTPGKLAERLKEKVEGETAGRISTELFSIISRELKSSESFSLFGFGTFKRVPVPISKKRNPQTGEDMIVPAHFRIKFTPAARVAERINAEYAHLKPLVLEDRKEHVGLLHKAERYVLSVKADPEPEGEETEQAVDRTVVSSEASTPAVPKEPANTEELHNEELEPTMVSGSSSVPSEEAERPAPTVETGRVYKEPDFGFEKDRRIGTQKKFLFLLGALALLLGMGWIILDRGDDDIESIRVSRESTPVTAPAEPQPATAPAAAAETPAAVPEPAVPPAETPPLQPPRAETAYNISSGDSFSLLAERQWGNISLWPYLYSRNREAFPDPDLVRPGDSIFIPPEPDTVADQPAIERSILLAYQRYRALISAQADNPRNPNRELSAGYVLLGGERLYPSFMERNRAGIRSEDIRRLEELDR